MKLKLEKPGLVELDPKLVHTNFDKRAIARLVKNYEKYMQSEMTAALDAAQREVDTMERVGDPRLFSFDQKKAEMRAQKVRKEAEAMASEEPPTAEPVSGHNPNIFPPFFNSFRSAVVGGVNSTPAFRLRPDIGQIRLSVAAFPPGGHIDRRAFMSAVTVAPSTEMVTAGASAFVGATIGAVTILGYGRASAVLLVSIIADGPAGFRASTGTLPLGAMNLGVMRLATSMTAVTRLMVNAGDMLLISCGLGVTAGCGGLVCSAASNVALSGTVLCLV